MCGEKEMIEAERQTVLGSPPRVRGKVPFCASVSLGLGITPACAGKRLFSRFSSAFDWDHPRVCGEKLTRRYNHMAQKGSPPRVRGKGQCGAVAQRIRRITPACAGKRSCRKSTTSIKQDHPRVCGEKLLHDLPHLCTQGSPPRMRGKDFSQSMYLFLRGITPAYAGKRICRMKLSTM